MIPSHVLKTETVPMLSILGYFDPGSGSLLTQMIVGGAAGLLVFGKYLWNLMLARRSGRGHPPTIGGLAASSGSSGEIPIDPSP